MGIDKIHPNSKVPIKKPKNGELTKKEKNKKFRKKRVKLNTPLGDVRFL